jgi:hypothetical protein
MEVSMVDLSKLHSLDDLIAKRRELVDALRLVDAVVTEYHRAKQRHQRNDSGLYSSNSR